VGWDTLKAVPNKVIKTSMYTYIPVFLIQGVPEKNYTGFLA
jgi:hypothetical protein